MSQDVDPVRLVLWSRSVPGVRSPVPSALSEAMLFVQHHRRCMPESPRPEPDVPRSTPVLGLVTKD